MYLSKCLVWAFSLGVLPALFYFVSLFLLECLKTSQAESGLKFKRRKQAFSNLSANLTTVIESRLSYFKRDLVEERHSSVASVVKDGVIL